MPSDAIGRARSGNSRVPYHSTVTDEQLRGEVIDAAIDLLLHGADGKFSMRVLAARIGVTAPTIYRRVGDKNTVLSIAVDRLLQRIELPSLEHGRELEQIRLLARRSFTFFNQHQALVGVFARGVVGGHGLLRIAETWLTLFTALGLPPIEAAGAMKSMMRHIAGSVSQYQSSKTLRGQAWSAELEVLTAERYPHCHSARSELADNYYSNDDFETGMDIILSGVCVRAAMLNDSLRSL